MGDVAFGTNGIHFIDRLMPNMFDRIFGGDRLFSFLKFVGHVQREGFGVRLCGLFGSPRVCLFLPSAFLAVLI